MVPPTSRAFVSVLRADEARPAGDNEWGAIALAYRSDDRSRAAGIWSFGPGSFEYNPNHEELLYVIDGDISVTLDTAESFTLTRGDVAYFPAHISARWVAPTSVKAAFCSLALEGKLDY